jgi:hypothetical protein
VFPKNLIMPSAFIPKTGTLVLSTPELRPQKDPPATLPIF